MDQFEGFKVSRKVNRFEILVYNKNIKRELILMSCFKFRS